MHAAPSVRCDDAQRCMDDQAKMRPATNASWANGESLLLFAVAFRGEAASGRRWRCSAVALTGSFSIVTSEFDSPQ